MPKRRTSDVAKRPENMKMVEVKFLIDYKPKTAKEPVKTEGETHKFPLPTAIGLMERGIVELTGQVGKKITR